MKRVIALSGAAIVVLGTAVVLLAPTLAQRYAEAQVDRTLKRMRVQTTSVVDRGGVSFDFSSRAVTVKNLTIESARREQRISVAALTIVGPHAEGEQLNAERVIFDDVTVRSAGETITVPRVEIENYSGPERGLTATPGVGRNARNQADLIALVSLERAVAPVVLFSGDDTALRRTLRNVAINRVIKGVVESATIDGLSLEFPYIPPDQSQKTSSLTVAAGPLVAQGVSLPTLWRFYAGDGAGDRQPLVKTGVVANLTAVATLRPGGEIRGSWRRLTIDDFAVRPLAYPVTTFDPFAAKIRLGEKLTPAEIREQLLFGADGLRAISFHRVAIEGARAAIVRDDGSASSLDAAKAEIGPYADGRLDTAKIDAFALRDDGGTQISLDHADAHGLQTKGLLDWADSVGRDEALLTTQPTALEIVRFAPRLASLEARGLKASGAEGALDAATVKAEVDAPLAAVPQRVAFTLDDLDARPKPGSPAARVIEPMRLDKARGGLRFSLTLDPIAKTLALDRFDYRFAQIGAVAAKGELSSVDPALLVSTGADFVEKFSAIELGTFTFAVTDGGAVETVLRRGASDAETPVEIYREQIAREAQDSIFRLFGPPSKNSADAAAQFIRDPRTLEIIVAPRAAAAPLLDFIRAIDLGPAGVAQVIDVKMLYKR